ncbi:XdhC family protein [Flammeovirga yaeyamensis]|uniref:XdhC family protein n=1 Tax=Flammeovirga yaeyamensis TaxID=367791 RepID=A0AAX1NAW2_9BACT|nr:XdhC family protein [Flammeovirga yaeyamensis]MBB3699907.1 xanthine/CO dehydrogenase XdhC/CoxF family maturation factor [Flammeovirga yaeyamensis]NMF38297.1 XdhC family protein [Flammeovirga yaeyamensis]QWG04709.1 XdhC family protein [Flammeovirga yaeyamensis]
MLHELQYIVQQSYKWNTQNLKTVLVTVVALDGSSYRKPGVRMLISEEGDFVGAVSGGCVENEIRRQSVDVFQSGLPKVIRYNGKLRLGCEGVLSILIEPLHIDENSYQGFQKAIESRKVIECYSLYSENVLEMRYSQTRFICDGVPLFSYDLSMDSPHLQSFHQTLLPIYQLYIFGVDHDALPLAQFALGNGWKVNVVDSIHGKGEVSLFPEEVNYIKINEDEVSQLSFDHQTGVVLMTHNLIKDLHYLTQLQHQEIGYIGILGAKKRKKKLLQHLEEFSPDVSNKFLESIHSPCGLDIGAETPQEIAISIMAEIIQIQKNKKSDSTLDQDYHITINHGI